MKVQRYASGRSNVGMLEQQRSRLISPQEAAQAAAAPFNAIGDAASNISDDLFKIQEKKERVQDENDKLLAATDIANTSTDLDIIRKQAIQERWTQEEYTEAANAIISDFVGGVSKISERNQEQTGYKYGTLAERFLADVQLNGVDIQTDRTKEAFDASFAKLGEQKDYQAQLMMLDVASEDTGIQLFEPAVLDQMRLNVEGEAVAEGLMADYETARKAGLEDEYLMSLADKDLTDEALAAFGKQKKTYDALTVQVETELKRKKALDVAQMTLGISATTTDEAMETAFVKLGLTDYGILTMWYNRREKARKSEQAVNAGYLDPYSKTDRKDLNGPVDATKGTPQDKFDTALALTVDAGASPQWLDGYFNSNSLNPNTFVEAAENWIRYHESTNSIPLGVATEAVEKYEMYRDLKNGMDPVEAATTVQSHYSGLTKERVSAQTAAWDDKQFGDGDMSPRGMIAERVVEMLEDSEEATLAVQGYFGNDVVAMPPQMVAFVESMSRATYGSNGSIEATAGTIMRSLQNSGWQVSLVNKGIDSGNQELGPMWMKNPPNRPVDVTRLQLETSLDQAEFMVNGVMKSVDPDAVEIWQNATAADGTNGWRIRENGNLIYNKDGTPAIFTYAKQSENDKPVTDEAVKIIDSVKTKEKQKEEEASTFKEDVRKFLGISEVRF